MMINFIKKNSKKVFIVQLLLFAILYFFLCLLSFSRSSFFLEQIEDFSWQKTLITVFIFLFIGFNFLLFFFLDWKVFEKIKSEIIVIIFLPIMVILLITPPFLSRDTAAYFIDARNFYIHHQNPYLVSKISVEKNSWKSQISGTGWENTPSSYGPLFNILLGPFFIFKIESLSLIIFVYKIFLAGLFLASVFLFKKIIDFLNLSNFLLILFIFNPAVLTHGLLEGHNDLIILFLLLLAVYFFLKNNFLKSVFFLAASVATKYLTLILLLIYWFKNKKIVSKKVGLSILIIFLVFLFLFSFFGLPFREFFKGIGFYQKYCLYRCSSSVAIVAAFGNASTLFRTLLSAFLYFFITYYFLIKSNGVFKFIFWSFFIQFFISVTWFAPWYLIPMIQIGLLTIEDRIYKILIVFLTFYSLMHYFGV